MYHLFFAWCSALCGLLADSEGGTMFRWEDNTCTVATYTGLPEDYQDGKASLPSSLISNGNVSKQCTKTANFKYWAGQESANMRIRLQWNISVNCEIYFNKNWNVVCYKMLVNTEWMRRSINSNCLLNRLVTDSMVQTYRNRNDRSYTQDGKCV